MRAMVAFAAAYGIGPVSLADVAASQRMPFRYLEHVAKSLKEAGLIISRRGAAGGYELARSPELITVADILRAVEGGVLAMECGSAATCSYVDAVDQCATKPLWDSLQQQVERSLAQVTLANVVSRWSPQERRRVASSS